jgi:glycosyltransferase involved in cell wall biosynthesis
MTSTTTPLPRISIVTPSLNQARYLETAIQSVLSQDYPNLEYIIRDGGSTDGSVDILRRYESRLAQLAVEPDGGPAEAINRGFAAATGDILAWLNADDLYLPGALRAVAAAFTNQPEARLVYGEGWYIDEAGERIEPCRFVRRRFDRRYLVNRDPILQPAAFWRRSVWEGTGPLDTSLRWVFDWEWFIRAYGQTAFHYVPVELACYRIQPQALTRTGGLARQLEHGRVTRRYGAWWHPNHVVQQTRRLDAAGQRLTAGWPRSAAWLARLPLMLPRIVAERFLYGMYMR